MNNTNMRPIRDTMPLGQALTLIKQSAVPLTRTERLPLEDADARVLASDIVAAVDVPPFNRAAMDGFAVIAEDTFGASSQTARILQCIETVHTGRMPTQQVEPGKCTEIATGAPMPKGADAVVMVEHTGRGSEDEVCVFNPVYPQQNVGHRAADIATGQVTLSCGDLLTPSRLGSIAALGIDQIEVFDRPKIAILSTGNEIIDPGQQLNPGQIYDINRFTLGAIIREHGGVPISHPTSADTLEELETAVEACRNADVLVFSGGSSVGERDLTLDVLEKTGEVLFHGIAVKPGKPTVFGKIGVMPVFGMPGYPTSCLSNAYMLLVPLLRLISHLPPHHPRTISIPTAQRIVSTTGRHQFYTVRVINGEAVPAFKASGDITSMSKADGYIEIPAQTDIVEEGEVVEVKLF